MNLTPYVESLRRELGVAAEAGGEDARALAERLTGPLESAARLALLEALSAAADEITRELAPGSVSVRLRGREPEFVVTPPPAGHPGEGTARHGPEADPVPPPPPPSPEGEEGGLSRITLRLPEYLKPHIEEAARHAALSVNAWLVRAVTAALVPADRTRRPAPHSDAAGGQRFTGWVR